MSCILEAVHIGFRLKRLFFVACVPGMVSMPMFAALPERVEVPRLKTSIYVGSVSLTTTSFGRSGDVFRAEYTAEVFPWFFWNESGEISLTVPEADLLRLRQGEQIEFTGAATNHKGKPRAVTGRARPESADDGSIKVRINADGIELIFNGRYQLVDAQPALASAGQP